MARILLGVSGGIAAYKAVELVRLATSAGHAVRVVQTPASLQLRRPGDVRGRHRRAGAGRRVRARPGARRLPGRAARPTTTRSRTSSSCAAATPTRSRPRRRTRSPSSPPARPTTCSRAPRSPATRAAGARAGDERPHVRAPGHAGQPRDAAAARRARSSRRRGPARLEGRVGGGPAGRAGARSSPRSRRRSPAQARLRAALARRAARARHRRRHARADRLRPLRRQPLVGPHGARAGRGGRPARRRGHAWSPRTCRCRAPTASRYVDVETAAELEAAARAEFAHADVLLMAAAVADFRPAAPEDAKIKKAGRDALELELEPTTDVLAALAAVRRAGQTLVGFAAEHGERAVERGAREARAQGPRRRRRQRHLARGHRLRRRGQRGHDRHRERRARRCRTARRARSRRRSSTRSSALRTTASTATTLGESHERERLRPVQERQRAARGGRLRRGRDPARAGPLARARQDLDPRGARPRLLPLGPLRGGRARSSRRSSSATRSTTTPTSASAARCEKTGRRSEARRHAVLAAGMRPDRADYRALRDRLRAA